MTDHPFHNEATRAHYRRSQRRNMRKMALSMGIIPDEYESPLALWQAITDKMAGGVASTRETIIGDPFAFFLTRTCAGCKQSHTFVIKSPTGGPIERDEAE